MTHFCPNIFYPPLRILRRIVGQPICKMCKHENDLTFGPILKSSIKYYLSFLFSRWVKGSHGDHWPLSYLYNIFFKSIHNCKITLQLPSNFLRLYSRSGVGANGYPELIDWDETNIFHSSWNICLPTNFPANPAALIFAWSNHLGIIKFSSASNIHKFPAFLGNLRTASTKFKLFKFSSPPKYPY